MLPLNRLEEIGGERQFVAEFSLTGDHYRVMVSNLGHCIPGGLHVLAIPGHEGEKILENGTD